MGAKGNYKWFVAWEMERVKVPSSDKRGKDIF
jgi:hypothetical protein